MFEVEQLGVALAPEGVQVGGLESGFGPGGKMDNVCDPHPNVRVGEGRRPGGRRRSWGRFCASGRKTRCVYVGLEDKFCGRKQKLGIFWGLRTVRFTCIQYAELQ